MWDLCTSFKPISDQEIEISHRLMGNREFSLVDEK